MRLRSGCARAPIFWSVMPGCLNQRHESGLLLVSGYFQDYLAVVFSLLKEFVGFDRAVEGENVTDLGSQFAVGDPIGELFPRRFHDFGLLGKVREPQALEAGRFGVHGPEINFGLYASGGAVLDDSSEVAQAAEALGSVFAAQHFEDCVHTFTVGEIFHGLLVIMRLVGRTSDRGRTRACWSRRMFSRRMLPIGRTPSRGGQYSVLLLRILAQQSWAGLEFRDSLLL